MSVTDNPLLAASDDLKAAIKKAQSEEQPTPDLAVTLGEIVHYREPSDTGETVTLRAAMVTSLDTENGRVSLNVYQPNYQNAIGGVSEGDAPGQYRLV